MDIPPTLPVSPNAPPVTPAPASPPTMKPTDLSGCVVWLETHADGSLVNRFSELTGQKQTVIVSSDPINPERGILAVFDRELTEAEYQMLAMYITEGTEPYTADTKF